MAKFVKVRQCTNSGTMDVILNVDHIGYACRCGAETYVETLLPSRSLTVNMSIEKFAKLLDDATRDPDQLPNVNWEGIKSQFNEHLAAHQARVGTQKG